MKMLLCLMLSQIQKHIQSLLKDSVWQSCLISVYWYSSYPFYTFSQRKNKDLVPAVARSFFFWGPETISNQTYLPNTLLRTNNIFPKHYITKESKKSQKVCQTIIYSNNDIIHIWVQDILQKPYMDLIIYLEDIL